MSAESRAPAQVQALAPNPGEGLNRDGDVSPPEGSAAEHYAVVAPSEELMPVPEKKAVPPVKEKYLDWPDSAAEGGRAAALGRLAAVLDRGLSAQTTVRQ